jgi:hypothetical protein
VLEVCSGHGWIPFARGSGSILVDLMARVEEALRLDRRDRISPRILVLARRKECSDHP